MNVSVEQLKGGIQPTERENVECVHMKGGARRRRRRERARVCGKKKEAEAVNEKRT